MNILCGWNHRRTFCFVLVNLLALMCWAVSLFAQIGLSDEERQKVQAHAAMITAEGLYDHKDYDKAIDQWREAIRLDPSLVRAHHDLGLALRGEGDLPGAITALREA